MKVQNGHYPLTARLLRCWFTGETHFNLWHEVQARKVLAGIPSIYE